jgi:putative hydrolase
MPEIQNATIASRLDEVALLLEEQGANPFRVQAYHRAANTLRNLEKPVGEVLQQEGIEGLEALPGIGVSIARAIRDLIVLGRFPMLDRLRGEHDPLTLLRSVPGIGEKLAHRLHDDLGIDSLEDLEMAAHDGRLRNLAGIGDKRLAGIRDSLATRLGRVREPREQAPEDVPPVSELLDVDAEYRARVEGGELRKIAPHRFNPTHEAWLPILHTHRGKREYTALFSNTARAHKLGRTRDWVVLYHDGGRGERTNTVITARYGSLEGKRIVRGRESECERYYRREQQPQTREAELPEESELAPRAELETAG